MNPVSGMSFMFGMYMKGNFKTPIIPNVTTYYPLL
jgi:hypothetical protein